MHVPFDRIRALRHTAPRVFLGITGPPGSGKSTLAEAIARELNTVGDPPVCAVVPMDGFHLSDAALAQLGRLERKGAIDTFDGWGYLSALRRLESEVDHDVFVPSFERTLEQPIAAGIIVPPTIQVVVTEGNYLLMDEEPWSLVREFLDEVWFCNAEHEVRIARLVARHIEFGKSPAEARRWVARVDEANAEAVNATAGHADRVVDMPD